MTEEAKMPTEPSPQLKGFIDRFRAAKEQFLNRIRASRNDRGAPEKSSDAYDVFKAEWNRISTEASTLRDEMHAVVIDAVAELAPLLRRERELREMHEYIQSICKHETDGADVCVICYGSLSED